jgi:hypothetical protein
VQISISLIVDSLRSLGAISPISQSEDELVSHVRME